MTRELRRRLQWVWTGRDIPEAVYSWLTQPVRALIIAALALGLGIAGSLFSSEIKADTSRLFVGPRGDVAWLIAAFWLCGTSWGLLFYLRLIAESEQSRRFLSAVHRCPNPWVLRDYKQIYDRIDNHLARAASFEGDVAPETQVMHMRTHIRLVLGEILDLARSFSDALSSPDMACNLMLILHPSQARQQDGVLGCLMFFDLDAQNLDSLSAVLHMPPELVLSGAADPHVDPISLPVPPPGRRALPGAPFALQTGKMSVHRDTRLLPEICQDFDASIREQLRRYFSPEGAGRNIRSFASLRIGDATNPVGVLNVDCSATDVLGPEMYYGTFFALMAPILSRLQPVLHQYARLSVT